MIHVHICMGMLETSTFVVCPSLGLLSCAAALESWHLHAKEQRHMEDVCSKIVSHMLNREVCLLVSFGCVVCGNALPCWGSGCSAPTV